jgi:hypothetical protein
MQYPIIYAVIMSNIYIYIMSNICSMYINKYEGNLGKHLTGDPVSTSILLLTLPFVLRNLIAPEVCLYTRDIQIMHY